MPGVIGRLCPGEIRSRGLSLRSFAFDYEQILMKLRLIFHAGWVLSFLLSLKNRAWHVEAFPVVG